MIPFTSADILGEGYRAYNFYLSQLRIRIEMAFGLLTTKWRRLRSILNFATCKNAQIIRVCTKLHNFVIHMAHAGRWTTEVDGMARAAAAATTAGEGGC
jgi:hypothetical protein